MMQGNTVIGLTGQLLAAGIPKIELLPVVLCHPSGNLSFEYQRQGYRQTVGEIGHSYSNMEVLVDEIALSIGALGCPTKEALYEVFKMDGWLEERLLG